VNKPIALIKEFLLKNLKACFFPFVIFSTLALSRLVIPDYLPSYDVLFIVCLFTQWWMIKKGIETIDELKVITLFHLMGLAMEIFKVNQGSWSYPETAFLKIAEVPIYSGFMYASVASYLCQSWRRFQIELNHMPSQALSLALATSIYFNFFTHHFIFDFRWILFGLFFVLFRNTKVVFVLGGTPYKLSLTITMALCGLLIWGAENLATYLGAWKYAYQHVGWKMVSFQKVNAWVLMSIVSFILVAQLKHVKTHMTLTKSLQSSRV
jgi:uncharacterized membrane protein YoaT (DUF817 family)